MIEFSIIIPVYNLETCITKTLESICENNLENAEVIVVDDGSSDNTKSIAEEYLLKRGVKYFQIISQENKGVSVARNAGIEKANGKYLIFCDGDDLCAGNLLEEISYYNDKDYDVLAWRYYIRQGEQQKVSQKEFVHNKLFNGTALKNFLLSGDKIRLGSFAVKKSLLEKEHINFTVGCAIAEDIEFMYKCLAVSQSVYTINDILFTYIKRAGSAMNQFDWKRFQAPDAIRRVYDFAKDRTDILSDLELKDYLYNGLYILHCMFSFDSCIQHLTGCNMANAFIKQYVEEYHDLEIQIKLAFKKMRIFPKTFSRKRILLFWISRKIYVYYFVILKKLSRKG